MNLTDDQLDDWLSKLRSGRYLQTTNRLCHTAERTGYCCMGVAGITIGLTNTDLQNDGFLTSLFHKVKLKFQPPFTKAEEQILSDLNDNYRLTFTQIAAFVAGGGLEILVLDHAQGGSDD